MSSRTEGMRMLTRASVGVKLSARVDGHLHTLAINVDDGEHRVRYGTRCHPLVLAVDEKVQDASRRTHDTQYVT